MWRYVIQLLRYTRYRLHVNGSLVANENINWCGRGEAKGIALYANIQFLKAIYKHLSKRQLLIARGIDHTYLWKNSVQKKRSPCRHCSYVFLFNHGFVGCFFVCFLLLFSCCCCCRCCWICHPSQVHAAFLNSIYVWFLAILLFTVAVA